MSDFNANNYFPVHITDEKVVEHSPEPPENELEHAENLCEVCEHGAALIPGSARFLWV